MDVKQTTVFCFLAVIWTYADAIKCPRNYYPHGNLCYKYEGSHKSWDAANAYCKVNGGQELVSWANDNVGRFLRGQTHGQTAWIGLRDYNDNNRYYWMDRKTEYTNQKGSGLWYKDQPKNRNEHCVHFNNKMGMMLNDEQCDHQFAFICKGCSIIEWCIDGSCESGPDSRSFCRKCQFTLKPSPDKRQCEKKCEYNNPCWPGTCAEQYLRNCKCAQGFLTVPTNSDKKNICQLSPSTKPAIEVCRTKVLIDGGKRSDSFSSNSSSTHCDFMQDFYGNFQPEIMSFDIVTSFRVDTSKIPTQRDYYQTNIAHFGVSDVDVKLVKKSIAGVTATEDTKVQLRDTSKGKSVTSMFTTEGNLTVNTKLLNGERLCLEAEIKGGGYTQTKDTSLSTIHDYEYDKTRTTRTICYIMDNAKPIHKSQVNASTRSPFEVSERISRTGFINVSFVDWMDPVPSGGNTKLTSGIEKYEVSLYNLKQANHTQSKGSLISSFVVNGTEDPMMRLNLTSSTPRLFYILLEVKDFADNLGLARRFVLYDNTSFIETDPSKVFTVTSASPATNFQWQTHHNDICMSWKDYFLNKVYMTNPFLDPIATDPEISGHYEQNTGELPIIGTPNVYGIIAFNFSWSQNENGTIQQEGPIPDFIKQTYCQNIPSMTDGDTYDLNITAIDIVNNSHTEFRTVHIDRTVPHINNVWLINDGYESLFAHGDKNGDLTEITISFDVLDPHSGIEEIEWVLGTSDGGREMIMKNISVNETETCDHLDNCICPSIGKCQITKYVVSLKGNILQKGNHNRNYFFTIKATNHARLSNMEHMEILVDTSPPKTGVVMEGPKGSRDIDYTSSSDFMVHWEGFVDHESGIKGYRVALAERCLTANEMRDRGWLSSGNLTIQHYEELMATENSIRMAANFTGKHFVTISALNNAAELSEPSCSDGITRDFTAPLIRNVTLLNGRWRETLHCDENNDAWFLHSSLIKVHLDSVAACIDVCRNTTFVPELPNVLLEREEYTTDAMTPEFICMNYDIYSKEIFIYLPSDHLEVSWDVHEDGSQIEEFYVGIGSDLSESVSPSLMAYAATHKNNFYKKNHAGFSTDDSFYMFIKAVNKAGLETLAAIGPIIIDETPPVMVTHLDLSINRSHVIVGWKNDTFVDPEQENPISSLMFQIESNGDKVTPLLEWNRYTSESCFSFSGGCISYPIRHLQSKDTREGREYKMVLFVYNNAGHMLRSTTEPFRVPSKYPPGHGTVLDIDPSSPDMKSDIDAHMMEQTLCFKWSGFQHHENISVEVGVGISPNTDTIYSFEAVPNNGSFCLLSPDFKSNVKYFVTIRSSCTGGVTLSSSNGVTIINGTEILNSLNVRSGIDCKEMANSHTEILNMTQIFNDSFYLNTRLRVGHMYYLEMYDNDQSTKINIETQDGIAEVVDEFWYKLIPFKEQPLFRFIDQWNCTKCAFSVSKCRNCTYLDTNSYVYAFWSVGLKLNVPIKFEVALGINVNVNGSHSGAIKRLSPFMQAPTPNSAFLQVNRTNPKAVYRLLVRPCFDSHCLQYVASPGVKPHEEKADVKVLHAELEVSNCTLVDIKWDTSAYSDTIMIFQWAISTDIKATHLLIDWTTVLPSTKKVFHIKSCVTAPSLEHQTVYGCVKAILWSSLTKVECQLLNTTFPYTDTQQRVYELDSTYASWRNIKQLLDTRFLGHKLTYLLDEELDFGNSSSAVTAAMLMVSERNVTWYLMASRHVPSKCRASSDCITSQKTTSSNYVIFEASKIPRNKLLYSCAFSEATNINRESHVETVEEFESCSDGFVIDTVKPTAGDIVVPNYKGYITNIGQTTVYWDGFNDNIDTEVLGYIYPIKYYTISAGSKAGSDDLSSRTKVGHTQTHIFNDLVMADDGTSIFITVTATDQAGLQTSVTSDRFILDATPPSIGQIQIEGSQSAVPVVSSNVLNVYLTDFNDPHSGLDYFEVGIGSRDKAFDFIPSGKYFTSHITVSLKNFHTDDGKGCYVTVKAVNRAGLHTEPTSRLFIIDRSPPFGGHVLDGPANSTSDLEYQSYDTHIAGHWYGFSDHHTGILYYRVALGSRPYFDDEETMIDVGLKTSVVWRRSFSPGMKYYITVECCNKAGLCRRMSSNGITIDPSGPIPGRVRVGHMNTHGKYQAKNTSVHIQWSGFSDTESGIDHFEVCLGSGPHLCDIHSYFNCLLSTSVTKTGLDMPVERDVYVTVKAFNKVGMSVIRSSDAFKVDLSPPELIEKPSVFLKFNSVANIKIQFDPSVLRIKWKFEDFESPVTSHYLTLKTHHEGHSPVDNMVLGSADRVTISLDKPDWLHNGDKYYVVVTSCNAAGLCRSAESGDVMIDSTPPHQGGFTSDLKWKNFQNGTSLVSLAWHSFVDAESSIKEFYITVSRNYSGSELSGGVITKYSDNSTNIQQESFSLKEKLNRDDKLYLTIWARNWAGLNSSVSKISVNALVTSTDPLNVHGILEIEKHSCMPQYCSGDCTCAVVGKPCEKPRCSSNATDSTKFDFPDLRIYFGLPDMVQKITTSTACMAAHWNISKTANVTPEHVLRYEYSIGVVGEHFGTGVLRKDRIPWTDVGQQQEVVYCLTDGLHLKHAENYVFYVRAWFGPNTFHTYNSDPLLVDQTAPSIKRGGHIKDSDFSCQIDLDVIDWMDTITACWSNVFIEQQGNIVYYSAALGTKEAGDDVMQSRNVELQTNLTITNITLKHGTKYYFTVTAYNNVGLHTTLSSDGFMIDMDTPRKGVVFNTKRYRNTDFHCNSSSFSISWNGFTDDQSGIKTYLVALIDAMDLNNSHPTFISTQLMTQYTFDHVTLSHGHTYHGLVKALDTRGHESDVAISQGQMIDTTAPEGFRCSSFDLIDTSELSTSDFVAIFQTYFSQNDLYEVKGYIQRLESEALVYFENGDHRLRLQTAVNHDGSLQFEYSFLSPFSGLRNTSVLIQSTSNIVGNTSLRRCTTYQQETNDGIIVQQIGTSLLAVNILVLDRESSIYKVLVGVGATPGGFQIRPLLPVSGGNNGVIQVNAQHGTDIHVTALVENHAGLKSIFHSKPIVFDHTGPELKILQTALTLANNSSEEHNGKADIPVIADISWSAVDRESGLRKCYCSFGYFQGSEDLMPYTRSETNSSCSSDILWLSHGTNVYGNVRCVNNVEIKTDVTTEKMTLIVHPPSANQSEIKFIPLREDNGNANEGNNGVDGKLGDHNIQSSMEKLFFEWTGFKDTVAIESYEYRVIQNHATIVDWIETKKTYASPTFLNNELIAGNSYTVEVLAVNKAGLKSLTRRASIFVDNQQPQLTGHPVTVSLNGRSTKVNWSPVFASHPLFPCLFSVTIGTRKGSADVADIRNTKNFETEVKMPDSGIDGGPVQELYIGVECIYPTGMSRLSMFNHRLNF